MKFDPGFPVCSIVTNNEITKKFHVGNMGGMRRSKTTGTLVIICDHTKGLYDDKWYGNELHYTGMGKTGDQVLTGNQNKTLAESVSNGVEVHLFEVFEPSQYVYQGVVQLSGKPFQEKQKDNNGNLRNVWMFPLKTTKKDTEIEKHTFDAYTKQQERKAEKLSDTLLQTLAKSHSSNGKISHRSVKTETYVRDPYIAEYAKRRAHGICQLCGKPAPFKGRDGKPYLESHHIEWLSNGGEDSIENTVALCPNCHKKMHIIADPADIAYLKKKVKKE